MDDLKKECDDLEMYMKKREKYCSAEIKALLFDKFLIKIYHSQNGIRTLTEFWKKV